ncbi:hypothetical protein [Streptomyces sp. ITFR-16]|uniref:hypothetical protein n=1 Tax=Streptomyces sp. ITFR-16 TaxID=3075198 RepID=UPI00288AD03B|nr:hypothetical protein [Streptomyces sp. ITFR-16]WNI23270.1 hypothetical protein RLT58_15630 [Streptomyces sp. ITFR-16]
MGIESDQLVYDYLSRVGDLAQQQHLSSGTRMRLVAELRDEIDRQRVRQAADTPAAVRRIIGTLGTPDELVAAAADGTTPPPPPQAPDADGPPGIPRPRRSRLRKQSSTATPKRSPRKPGSRKGESEPPAEVPAPFADSSSPHRAGTDELGPTDGTEWWSVAPGPFGEFGAGTQVPGFRGGVEIPAVLRPPVADEEEEEGEEEYEDEEAEQVEQEAAGLRRRRWLPKLRRAEDAPPRGFTHPLLLLAAALLVTGAVLGSLPPLAGGWLLAYSSRKLSRAEAKWAVLGLPGLVAAGAVVWLWGRMEGRWGAAIPEHGMADALSEVWPVTLRTAAVASALFLIWRSRRRPE